MATNPTSPPYSFVQFGAAAPDNCCNGINTVCLPVFDESDLHFQIISDGAPGALAVVRGMDGSGDIVSSQSGFLDDGSGNAYHWQNPIDLGDLEDGECFQLKIGSSYSNCFQRRLDDCFTTVINYYNYTDYAGFVYCNSGGFVNRVRLFMYLSKPTLPEDRGVYRKSSGFYKITKSVITKEYLVQTDFMTQQMHEALIVALAHDSINVEGSEYTGNITKSGEYNQPWEEGMCVVQANFKVAATPFEIKNNNCQTCDDPVDPPPPPPDCDEASIEGFLIPDGSTGVPYDVTITITGTAPFVLGGLVVPSWMSVSLSGSTIQLTGTPDAPGLGETVQIGLSNCAGSSSDFINQVINIS